MNLNYNIKKNLLDLEYNKNLQYFNTTIVILFTYIIGLVIAFVTKQIDVKNNIQLSIVTIISLILIFVLLVFLVLIKDSMKKVISQIKELKI
ncbi:hypothetical protein J4476_04030 [Candidatus Woesearchaeota archaeon]|nr:MAG: hypothetical protein QT09_C0009G0028 [archaeon GW2011_AR18]MBS3161833.1 hypothetical protein [Candidatus Woesearchaeota archaeon]HIH26053.1 hypothetical protein [Nanoarchaeota archaeon]